MRDIYTYNEKYLIRNNKPWFPIMGELHYSRVNKSEWKESLYKMKATGVDVVSTYTFWIHHEEIQGEYIFEGNFDLRAFIETVQEVGLSMFIRIGPWCHGEVRNGGFPDWLMNMPIQLRSNDANYLAEVEKFYSKIYDEIKGLFHHEGGPIIGVQIENEYGHCGGLTGDEGEKHMTLLTEMAKDIGFQVPYYTATGWGGAVCGGLIPVMGGYCEAPWDQRLTEIEPSGNYILTHERNDHNIGSDYGFCTGITFDISKYPYLTAELGGGLQVTYHRRPKASGKDISAMSLAKLGSGVNLLGYYMYHGGTNPKGKLTSLQETRDTGAPNDYQILNYDFQAAIRQYGQVSETAKELKLWAYFIKDFGESLCEMTCVIPEENPAYPTNTTDLRYSFRLNDKSGYVFINNYQKGKVMDKHSDISIHVPLEEENLEFPKFDMEDGEFLFYPFNMPVGEVVLKTALATPLCKLNNDNEIYIFYTDKEPRYEFEGNRNPLNIITLTREEALNAWKVKSDKEYLIISNGIIVETDQGINVIGQKDITIKCYPPLKQTPNGFEKRGIENGFAVYEKNCEDKAIVIVNENNEVTDNLSEENKDILAYDIDIDYGTDGHNLFINIDYEGDKAKLYMGEELVADHFYYGDVWEIGLKNIGYPTKLKLVIEPLTEGNQVYMEKYPAFKDGIACRLKGVTSYTEYNHLI